MRIFLTVTLTFILPLSAKSLGLDLEGSGYDLVSSGTGSGDWSFTGEETDTMDDSDRRDQIREDLLWSIKESDYIILSNSKNFWENEQIVAAVTAGGVVGVVLAAMITGVLIYIFHGKEGRVYIEGRVKRREMCV